MRGLQIIMNALASGSVRVGDMIAGKYRVERMLGAGGMGIVFSAMHVDLHERRAIKLMHSTELGNAQAVERFLREARAAVRLRSEHVAKVYDIGRLENGAPYMVIEFLDGMDLNTVMKTRNVLPVEEAVLYVLQACDAIAEAHALGIVHRDLKPANLFLTTRPNGSPCVKVLDFGISKQATVAGSPAELGMTKTHEVFGSPSYMSPEQMRSARAVTARSDIWSLGVILYRFITGRLPFEAMSAVELISLVLEQHPPRPSALRPGLSPALDGIMLRCLEKDPGRRIASIEELVTALLPFAPEERHSASRISHGLSRPLSAPSNKAESLAMPKADGATTGTTMPWVNASSRSAKRTSRTALTPLLFAAGTGLGLVAAVLTGMFVLQRSDSRQVLVAASAMRPLPNADLASLLKLMAPSAEPSPSAQSTASEAPVPELKSSGTSTPQATTSKGALKAASAGAGSPPVVASPAVSVSKSREDTGTFALPSSPESPSSKPATGTSGSSELVDPFARRPKQ